jgi:hypothetical protein
MPCGQAAPLPGTSAATTTFPDAARSAALALLTYATVSQKNSVPRREAEHRAAQRGRQDGSDTPKERVSIPAQA